MKGKTRITSSILLCLYIAAVAYLCFARPDNLPQAPMYLFGLPMDKLAHFVMFVPFPILAYMTFVNLEMSIWRKIAVLTIIMAAGAFTQGSSIELSCDGPIRPPYVAYLQGGLTYEHLKIVCLEFAETYLA